MTTAVACTDDVGAQDGAITIHSWTPLNQASPDGSPVRTAQFAALCVQITGTFGAGTALLQGSNDGTNWFTLNNAQGSAISGTAALLKQVAEIPLWVRPNVTGADGTTALTCVLMGRRLNTLRR